MCGLFSRPQLCADYLRKLIWRLIKICANPFNPRNLCSIEYSPLLTQIRQMIADVFISEEGMFTPADIRRNRH